MPIWPTWLDLVLFTPARVLCTAEELGRGPAEPVVSQLGVLLTYQQGLEQTFGSLFVVIHCNLNQEQTVIFSGGEKIVCFFDVLIVQ